MLTLQTFLKIVINFVFSVFFYRLLNEISNYRSMLHQSFEKSLVPKFNYNIVRVFILNMEQ